MAMRSATRVINNKLRLSSQGIGKRGTLKERKMSNLIPAVPKHKQAWYRREKNTSALIRSVATARFSRDLSGDQIWSLITLTWITRSPKRIPTNHWKKLKVPALASLFNKNAHDLSDDLPATINAMSLPQAVAQAAKQETGILNARGTWRNSSRDWCDENRTELMNIIRFAAKLPANDQARFDLAERIDALPDVKSPNRKANLPAGVLLTPLTACLDPKNRFPIVNGRKAVVSLLGKLHLAHRDLRQQVIGLIGIIGQKDAFMLDVLSDEIFKRIRVLKQRAAQAHRGGVHESPLKNYDEEERKAVLASKTVTYRKRHNTMTAALNRIFKRFQRITETTPAGRCDCILEDYDGTSRDLLIEAKPDPDKGSLRIAIGQLFDYNRYRSRQSATDLALVTISRPAPDYLALLVDLGITALWFGGEGCKKISGGEGKAWEAVAAAIGTS